MTTKNTILQGVATLGGRGQVVIPQPIRRLLKLKPGDAMAILVRNGRIIIIPARELENALKRVTSGLDVLRRAQRK